MDDILLFSEIYPPAIGGSAVLFHNTYRHISDCKVRVLTDTSTSPGEDGEVDGIEVHRRGFSTKRWGLLERGALRDHYRSIRAIRGLAAQRRSIIHCARALPEGLSALLARPLRQRRSICWAHGEDVTTLCLSREYRLLIRQVFSRSGAVLANSANTRAIVEELGIPREHITVVHPGVDVRRFHPEVDGRAVRARYAPEDGFLLLTVGRFQKRKGQDHVIETLARLQPRYPGLRYLMVGGGEERARLAALVAQHGLEGCVFFAGEVSDEELPAHYAACDAFIHANRIVGADIEGFGIVFLEAQATARPVIGGRNGGVPETMIEGQTGMLVSAEDIEETARVIEGLITDAPRRRRMGAAARQHITERFSWERCARLVSEVQRRVSV